MSAGSDKKQSRCFYSDLMSGLLKNLHLVLHYAGLKSSFPSGIHLFRLYCILFVIDVFTGANIDKKKPESHILFLLSR